MGVVSYNRLLQEIIKTVRSPEFIDGVVGVEVGNARYTINDHTKAFGDRYQESFKL
jgi:hypothetical protein